MDDEHWLDASNNNPVTDAVREQAKAEGVAGICFNLLDLYPDHTVGELRAAREDGLRRAGYTYLNFPGGKYYAGRDGYAQVSAQLAAIEAAGESIEWAGIDCEDDRNRLGPADTVTFIRGAVNACLERGVSPKIYTAAWWWIAFTGDSADFDDIDLWNATNDGVADRNRVAYGGPRWRGTPPWAEQYTWHKLEGGDEYDESVIRATPVVAEEEGEMRLVALTDVQKVLLGAALGGEGGIFAKHFGDLVNTAPGDGYDVQVGDDPTADVVVFRMPKGTIG